MKAYRPENLKQLRQLLENPSLNAAIVAGGTDLIIQMQQKEIEEEGLIYLGRIAELKKIKKREGQVFIGACCTMTELSEHKLLTGGLGVLSEAAGGVGSLQVRNRATIGGNIAHGSAAADLAAPLMCLNAKAVILQEGKVVKIPVDSFIVGDKMTRLGRLDVILGFLIPLPEEGWNSHYYKLGFRKKVSISRFGIAISMKLEHGIVEDASVFIGAIGPKAVRMADIEQLLYKKPLTDLLIKETGKLLSSYIGSTSKRKYKMWASGSVMEDAFRSFLPQTGDAVPNK